jgi:tetratricopeptide (TPR) repeat protein
MVTLAAYQIEISRYDDAVRTARAIEREIPADLYDRKYRCAALLPVGVALFSSFQDIARAQVVLQQAGEYADRAADDPQVTRWLATAYHFLARIAEVERRYRDAVDLYLVGQKYQNRCPEEVGADAFIHLRIAEPLIASAALDDAREHLEEARRLVRTGSNISSARLQVELGFATLAAAGGQFTDAEAVATEALRSAREVVFWRGELLCLGYLLVLAVRRRRPDKMLLVAVRILRTAVFGELRRNKLTRLLLRIPVVLPIAIRRMARRPRPGSTAQIVPTCPCALHRRPVVEGQPDAVYG